jgi:xanthine dehydrogenase accessory factor
MDDPRALSRFFDAATDVVEVRVSRARGSTPRETGAVMHVSAGAVRGTIGGGQLEYMAIDEARALMAQGADRRVMDIPLGPEIGQCCGGRVEITLARMDAAARAAALAKAEAEHADAPHVLIFGAGHVGRALAQALAFLPLRTRLIDQRHEELGRATADVERIHTPLPEAEIANVPPGSAFVVTTHEHSLDFLISAEALARGDAAYVGMIGSKTKRVSFERWCRGEGRDIATAALVCPIGAAGAGDKRPEVIAAFVAAEILGRFAAVKSGSRAVRQNHEN